MHHIKDSHHIIMVAAFFYCIQASENQNKRCAKSAVIISQKYLKDVNKYGMM
jgi:hypothetical protein